MVNKIIRKPVPQISICKFCGKDFKYMRTLMERRRCDECISAKNAVKVKAWQARQRK